MPSPIYQCTSVADLQTLITRTRRVYPELDWRVLAAGGLIAADCVESLERFNLFRVADLYFEPSLVDLLHGTCSCRDDGAPIVRDTKLCEHVLACLVVARLAARAEDL